MNPSYNDIFFQNRADTSAAASIVVATQEPVAVDAAPPPTVPASTVAEAFEPSVRLEPPPTPSEPSIENDALHPPEAVAVIAPASPSPDPSVAAVQAQAPTPTVSPETKKVGFFGRIFGRRQK